MKLYVTLPHRTPRLARIMVIEKALELETDRATSGVLI
jgi:hypothetical protein